MISHFKNYFSVKVTYDKHRSLHPSLKSETEFDYSAVVEPREKKGLLVLFILFRERTIIGSVLYRNRYSVYRIESYRLLLYQGKQILCASLLRSHYTGDQRTFAPRHPQHARAPFIHDTGEGWRGGRRETVT